VDRDRPQRTEILAGTLAENIALFDPDLLPRAAAALRELGLTTWADSLPDGIETRLGEGGYKLSAGQEQLVAFARILVRDPHVVILDEATARMDPVTETWVQRATDRLLAGRIGVIVAHRLSSVQRCDEVIVLADGEVLEAGPLRESRRFAELLATSAVAVPALAGGGGLPPEAEARRLGPDGPAAPRARRNTLATAEPPPLPGRRGPHHAGDRPAGHQRPAVRPGRGRLFVVLVLLGLDGAILPLLWSTWSTASATRCSRPIGIAAACCWRSRRCTTPAPGSRSGGSGRCCGSACGWCTARSARAGSASTPRPRSWRQGGDTERVVMLADNLIDTTQPGHDRGDDAGRRARWCRPRSFTGTMVISGLAATLFGRGWNARPRHTVAAQAAFATALVSSLSAARTVKLAGATMPVLNHLADLDATAQRPAAPEISIQVWARSTRRSSAACCRSRPGAMYLAGNLSAAGDAIAVATLGAARWFRLDHGLAGVALPVGRVLTRRTVAMTGVLGLLVGGAGRGSVGRDGAGAADGRRATRCAGWSSTGFSRVHEKRHRRRPGRRPHSRTRGSWCSWSGPVGAGKSSLLRALAGIVHHTGDLRWNGARVNEPEVFLRPNQVGYVAQLPRCCPARWPTTSSSGTRSTRRTRCHRAAGPRPSRRPVAACSC
jgi:energy-coupling factor transporter ATP-binding protein EcfA2